jgi:hypothetical protein
MIHNLIGFIVVLIVLLGLFRYTSVMKEGFDFPVPEHQAYVEESQKKLNNLTNMVNLTDPVLPVQAVSASDMYGATHGLDPKGTARNYRLESDAKFEIPDNMPSSLTSAIGCQKAPKTCGAFDDSVFAQNCGMSFDKEGMGSNGKPHMGGLYVAPDDRAYQTDTATKVREKGIPPYDPYYVYQPSLGIAKPGTFALTKDQCVVVKEKVDCEAKQTFGSPNCNQCYTSQRFSRIDPAMGQIPSTLYLQGTGKISVRSQDGTISLRETLLNENSALKVIIPPQSEGKNFVISISQNGEKLPTYVSGYIEGQTGRGLFKLDLNSMVQSDLVTNTKPKMMGTKRVNGFRALSFTPGFRKTSMQLSCLMPFSFLNMYEPDAIYCDNGPVITKESSATFLESDPCYGKANQPGNYKLECLQSRWIALGGTTEGTGYPSNAVKANLIQKGADGAPKHIDDIMDTLSLKMDEAITGSRANGTSLSVPEWNEVSMWAMGVPIKSPCDGLQKDTGPLSKECLSYLYQNRGSESHVGSTYTMPPGKVASTKGMREGWQDMASIYAYPQAPMDPLSSSSLPQGGLQITKALYDHQFRTAVDNTLSNRERGDEIEQVYGTRIPSV